MDVDAIFRKLLEIKPSADTVIIYSLIGLPADKRPITVNSVFKSALKSTLGGPVIDPLTDGRMKDPKRGDTEAADGAVLHEGDEAVSSGK